MNKRSLQTVQSKINSINSEFFLHEFSFGKNEFTPTQETEREFCDHFIWLDDCAILVQAKERDPRAKSDKSSLSRWFNDKVVKYATKQVRDTLDYLSKYPSIEIKNEKEHLFNINQVSLISLYKLVIYGCCHELPNNCKNIKSHRSRTAGFIHIININDYSEICTLLKTPAEITEYLNFREKYLETILNAKEQPEKSLLGRFILSDKVPNMEYDVENIDFSNIFDGLINDEHLWDISFLLKELSDRRYFEEGVKDSSDYYFTLLEFLWLRRSELRELRARIKRAVLAVKNNKFVKPFSFINIKRSCGFVIIPIDEDLFDQRLSGLKELTKARKYENRLEKCIGVSISRKDSVFFFDYVFLRFTWVRDLEMERTLTENYPFRELKEKINYRYHVEI
ncbi:MAG: hypothetical protein HQ568_04340 [Calditrichaeota bacterium]|nr:hypothetical protein [Calditrichota bacterium]